MKATASTVTIIMIRLDQIEKFAWADYRGRPFNVARISTSIEDDKMPVDLTHVYMSGPAVLSSGAESLHIERYDSIPFLELPERFRNQITYELSQSSTRHAEGRAL